LAFVQYIDQPEVCTDWRARQALVGTLEVNAFTGRLHAPMMHCRAQVHRDASELLPIWRREAPGTLDWLITDEPPQPPSLFVSDMDSTIISIECIDALAARHGVGDQVAAITDRAMAGELDFEASLRARVAALKGCPSAMIEAVLAEEVRLNPNAGKLLTALRAKSCETMLVSGGFTRFAGPVAQMAGFDTAHANQLAQADGVLTGALMGPIIDAQAKAHLLRSRAAALGLRPEAVLAIGDGANDAVMLAEAGLAIGYRPRAALKAVANGVIASGDFAHLARLIGLPIPV
jgi:phosphoserine phosphatase